MKIDPRTGKLAKPEDKNAVVEWFRRDTEPEADEAKPKLQSDFLLQDQ